MVFRRIGHVVSGAPLAAALAIAGLAAGTAAAATPVSGFVSGQVVSVKSGSFVLKDAFGAVADSTVSLSRSSAIVEQLAASRSDLKAGACVTANGEKASDGTVDAVRITISPAVKGTCSNGFFGHGGGVRPGGPPPGANGSTPPANASRFGNFGFAAGSISAVDGDTITVKGTSTVKVALSSSTELTKMTTVASSAIAVDDCATVRGTSANEGLTVGATSVELSKPTTSGCGRGFPGRPTS